MFLQLRTMQTDELRKRASISRVTPKRGTAEPLLAHPAGIKNNAADSLGGKGTKKRKPG